MQQQDNLIAFVRPSFVTLAPPDNLTEFLEDYFKVFEYNWMFDVYPWLLFVSSIFLLATFIVYAIVPALHNNVHGISIMFHLASLTLVYITLGLMLFNRMGLVDFASRLAQEQLMRSRVTIPKPRCTRALSSLGI